MDYENIEPLILKQIPEIREEYLQNFRWWYDIEKIPLNPLFDKEIIQTDVWLLQLFKQKEYRIGATIVFENLSMPFLMSLFDNEKLNQKRLTEIWDWLEELASSENFEIKYGLIQVTVCESLLSKYTKEIYKIYPYLHSRPHLKGLCEELLQKFRLEKDIVSLFL